MSSLSYSLAGASLLLTFIVTILNGVCYATSKASSDVAPVILSAVSCVAVIALGLLHHKNIQTARLQCIGFTGTYLLIAAAASAGAMAMSPQASVFVVRSIFWALSVFAQALYCGYLSTTLAQEKSNTEWPRGDSRQLDEVSPNSNYLPSPTRVCHLSELFEPKRGSLRKYPRRSSRYSDTTLCPSNMKDDKNASIDSSSSSTRGSPSPTPTNGSSDHLPDRDPRSLPRGPHSIRSMPSLRRTPPNAISISSRVQPTVPSPTASTLRLDSPTPSPSHSTWEYNPFDENNIHPLFRSTSPCPSPTFAPGTIVKGSASAGQTITPGTIKRMRSARSLRDQGRRTPSPLPGMGLELNETHVRGNQTRGSPTHSTFEKYDLNESPHEK
ncbi:uncharacterized protein N7515_002977 [Penicillium bovifimosum]|uniref:Uncharacterized protein n=1 Tax=Penicillium bovifimosum TaxID=126998 RepID=A0A9W9HD96_9EURO|nr:uncharacterized protein N7515_002977 [Penicillium bovifimosum]KAJ5144190.1 hypothetical protein N7515_002977 [Penicillium bovifimosum]